jgi:hypothetical protein
MIEELMTMGFPREWCITALREKQNDMVDASTWIVDNLDFLGASMLEEEEEEEEEAASVKEVDHHNNNHDHVPTGNNECNNDRNDRNVRNDRNDGDDGSGDMEVVENCKLYFPADNQHDMSWYGLTYMY